MVHVKKVPIGSDALRMYKISATLVSEDIFGSRIGSNVVLIGALQSILKIADPKQIEKTLAEEWPRYADKNIVAFRRGMELGKLNRDKDET